MSRLALGTVQFGLDYGVGNASGRVAQDEVRRILARAASFNIKTLDTAVKYGDSEAVLGRVGVRSARVVTKLPAVPDDVVDVEAWVQSQIQNSLNLMKLAKVHAVLLHQPDQLLTGRGTDIYNALLRSKTDGLTDKIGVSVYEPSELDALCDIYAFDLVQAPLNILDQRVVTSGWGQRLRSAGVELHTRSAFLQGLLLMRANDRPPFFGRWQSIWDEWDRWLINAGLTPLEACLGYVMSIETLDHVIVGVDSLDQLNAIIAASQSRLPSMPQWPENLDLQLLNPARWEL